MPFTPPDFAQCMLFLPNAHSPTNCNSCPYQTKQLFDRLNDQRPPRRGSHHHNNGACYDNQKRPFSPNHRRSRSPTRRRSRSPRKRSHSPGRRRSRSPERYGQNTRRFTKSKPDFQSGASGKHYSACTVCLGIHQHKVHDCNASTTWDGAHQVTSKRINGDLILCSNNSRLCLDWQ